MILFRIIVLVAMCAAAYFMNGNPGDITISGMTLSSLLFPFFSVNIGGLVCSFFTPKANNLKMLIGVTIGVVVSAVILSRFHGLLTLASLLKLASALIGLLTANLLLKVKVR